jgi:hypothetical protein
VAEYQHRRDQTATRVPVGEMAAFVKARLAVA